MCIDCLQKVPISPEICPICTEFSFSGKTHPRCLGAQELNGLITAWRYQGVVRKSILALKYRFASDVSDELVTKYLKVISNISKGILAPIPLNRKRQNWRGFNQSEELGKRVAQKLNLKFVPDLLIKKTSTLPQARLTKKEREKNIRGVFKINPRYQLLSAAYYLFDDVWTTGSTMKEACKTMKRNGAGKVWGMTIVR
ncbi:MAG: Phosphoribosyltransferase [Candidatus Woesebacteria bacterium GW2011_GWB1_43_14]|uniref:Phosphoribosyltransferase n=1 Tax=Candidatus Woesebacteria bacterium GW2011_GWB1_43_14 TaxID=1618578 RepID=A0A0G1DN22_9BACT|nr:MAG: phosphoribosyltransferase [Candidatus Woesebacteria bacterium GW2011_GWC1_42_9]KKS98972.1 MAG: Phosphoribosyltransferase [Candidatus Woesebacteria bacterium GW2011_GWB1_43_14]